MVIKEYKIVFEDDYGKLEFGSHDDYVKVFSLYNDIKQEYKSKNTPFHSALYCNGKKIDNYYSISS